ncbi:gag-pol polyprotein [Ceraceosorus bombacis]|uniref:Gag-pol polyprotein n=1 Tax=Ceraceosorus bombacis TaxID=401625 RepID=A0A0P1BFS2_9BASI|nr:gag-pol polyprotein [Ceraceosorus bombacis]
MRSILRGSNFPVRMWEYALSTVVFVKNKTPHSAVKHQIPNLVFGGRDTADLSLLRTFGCRVWVHRPSTARIGTTKLAAKADPRVFCGYNPTTKGYHVYDPDTRSVSTATDVAFVEHVFPLLQAAAEDDMDRIGLPTPDTTDPASSTVDEFTTTEPATASGAGTPRRSTRRAPPPRPADGMVPTFRPRGNDPDHLVSCAAVDLDSIDHGSLVYGLATHFAVETDPNNYRQAMSSPSSTLWKAAMDAELQAQTKAATWTPVPCPDGAQVIHSQWVFKTKRNAQGEVEHHKARVVARGDQQSADSAETYAPVASMKSFRLLSSLAVHFGWELHQTDFDTAYLNAARSGQAVYMHPPPGMELAPGSVLQIDKALYGLRTSALDWFQCLSDALESIHFRRSVIDQCVFVRKQDGAHAYLAIHVDDALITGSSAAAIAAVKADLGRFFKIKDIGQASHCLGMQFTRSPQGLLISQQAYIRDISKRFQQYKGTHSGTPLPAHVTFSQHSGEPVKEPYLQVLGSLMWVMIGSRLDIAYAVGVLSRYSSKPGPDHWQALLGVLEYVRDTANRGLWYAARPGTTPALQVFCDVNFAGDTDTSRSTSGHLAQLGGHTISWVSQRQKRVSRSTVEAEYIKLSAAASTAVHLRELLSDIGLAYLVASPTPLFCDNEGAVSNAKNGKSSYRNCHVRIDEHVVRESVTRKECSVVAIRTKEQLADVFTKALARSTLEQHMPRIGIVDRSP